MLALPVQAKRLALVMGNDNYVSVSKLQKAGNDADAMARELKSAGFAVTSYRDLNYRSMVKAIDAFSESITGGDEVVVFYAGHGVQIKAGAYLLPVDIEAENEAQVERTSYGLNDLTERLAEAKPAFTLVMVDACRDNPMKVKGRTVGNTRGLNALEPPKGQMVVYSASRGQQALDRLSDNDSNPNGVFTREFITRMRTPGVKIDDLMRDVQDSVESLAKSVRHEQRPAVYNEARGNFYFYGPTTVQIQQGGGEAEERAWAASETANTVSAYQIYLDAYPKGKYVVAAKIKLDSFKQTPEQSSSETEAGLWAEVKATGTREYLEAYISQYPKGKYVVLARLELKKLDDAERAKAAKLALEAEQAKQREEQRVEQAAWDEAQKGKTANSYSAYLKKYPSGRFAAQARVAIQAEDERIAAAVRAEEERLKAEQAKKAEQERIAAEARQAEERRIKAELAKKVEQERLAAEAKKVAEEQARVEASKKAEDERVAAEARKAEEQRLKAELAKKAEEDRLAAETKKAAEQRIAALKPEMVVIPAGSFMMGSKSTFLFGSDGKNPEEKPQHLVKVPSFLMGKTEVTQGQWKSVMGSNPSSFSECGETCPVDTVSWNDAQDFIRKLNQITGQNYRLPSEAEWEYAARAGTTTAWSFGDDELKLGNFAWYSRNSAGQTRAVGQKMPNAFGLYDMHGNVWEWVEDCWHDTYGGAPLDAYAWKTSCLGDAHVTRGGSWNNYLLAYLRSAHRNREDSDKGSMTLGFRLASDLPTPALATVKKPEASTPLADTKKTSETVEQTTTKAGAIVKDCADCPEMVVISAGSFMMGSKSAYFSKSALRFGSDKNPEEQPQHLVKVPSFLMGKTEVTQGQWKSVMGSNPSSFSECGETCPVETVSWNDAQDFIRKLNQITGQNYRLPSEAEWEYAARAGTTTEWSFGDDESQLGNFAWYPRNSAGQTHAVGQKMPNAFGLYDMHGNVWEWVEDCWHATYDGAPLDAYAWKTSCTGDAHVTRGGSWNNYLLAYLRSAHRNREDSDKGSMTLGFRLASDLPTPALATVKKPEASTPLADTKKTSETVEQTTTKAGAIVKDCADCPEMVVIPAGSFMMGSEKNAQEQPKHAVTIRSFLMGKTEVTQNLWISIRGRNPSWSTACGQDCPVERVSGSNVQEFIVKLNQKTGQQYRLPSEAEWEYAARAGTTTEWSFGNDEYKLGNYAWYDANSKDKAQLVGQKLPNAFGLFDMHGNVWEMVEDCWHNNYAGAPADGSAWTTSCIGYEKMSRGGSFRGHSELLRSAFRSNASQTLGAVNKGFRLARDL